MKRPVLSFLMAIIFCGSSALAADPVVTSVTNVVTSTNTAQRAFVGNVRVEGSNFQSGATLRLCGGTTGALTGTADIPTTFVSSTELLAYTRVSASAVIGLRSPYVVNPDGGVSTLESGFSVVAQNSAPDIPQTQIYFDGVTYEALMTISRRPKILIQNITDPDGFTQFSADMKILIDNQVIYDNLSPNLTIAGNTATFSYQPPTSMPVTAGTLTIYFNLKDQLGNTGEQSCILTIGEVGARAVVEEAPLPAQAVSDPSPSDPLVIQYKLNQEAQVKTSIVGQDGREGEILTQGQAGYNKVYWSGTVGADSLSATRVFSNGVNGNRKSSAGVKVIVQQIRGGPMKTGKFVVIRGDMLQSSP